MIEASKKHVFTNTVIQQAEKIFTVVSLLHYSGGILSLILSGGMSEGDNAIASPDYPLIQGICFTNYLISLLLLAFRWKKVTHIIMRDRHIIVMLGLCCISYFWSATPSNTLIRTAATIGTSLFGIYIATRYSIKEQLQLLAWTFGIAICLSIIFVILIPNYGIMSGTHVGKWRGIYTHKNILGKIMSMSGIVFLLLALNEKKDRLILWGGFFLSIGLLIASNSSSAMINFVITMGVFCILWILLLNYDLLFPAIFFLAMIGQVSFLWLVNNTPVILNLVGKDASLTGRGPLWVAVNDAIWQRPWLGYGFSGFWKNWDTPGASVWRIAGWEAPTAHNGLLDLSLELGYFGLTIFLIGFAINVVKSLTWIRIYRTVEGFWPMMYLVYFWLINQTESSLIRQNEIFWLLYVTVSISMLIPLETLFQSVNKSK
jgi:exopolysaccharide production protein ExoQ